jgi:hypothetical protein
MQSMIQRSALGAAAALVLASGTAAAQQPAPTFSKDIAPILQQNCQVCHSPGSIAPMSLITYEEVRPWARVIRMRTETRQMPPWHIDKTVGIQKFKNDISISDEEIATIAAWVEAGAPEGDPKDLPAPIDFQKGNDQWAFEDQLGQPDLVLKTTPYTIPAQGQDSWWRPTVETGLTKPRWVRAVATRPGSVEGRKVTHHVLSSLVQEEKGITGLASDAQKSVMSAGLLTEWAIGKVGEMYPENTGKLMLPGSKISFEVHYSSMAGVEVKDDEVELAVWFYPEGYTPKYRTILNIFTVAGANTLEIEPNSMATFQNSYVLQAPARIESFQPHMHLRGKGMSMEAIYPDGHKELLSMVSNFDWRWHNNYIYAPDSAPLLPKGTVLNFVAWHDNRDTNPANPDPRQFITWGDRTVDEMAHAWVGVTYLEQADYERMVAERKNAQPTPRATGE